MLLHPLHTDIPLPERLNNPFDYEPHALCIQAAEEMKAHFPDNEEWKAEVERGKMFGVLVVEQKTEQQTTLGYLAAYSGQIAGRSDWAGFVPAVFDYLQPNGFFKIHEQEITRINREVEQLEKDTHRHQLLQARNLLHQEAEERIEAYKAEMQRAKRLRDTNRKTDVEGEKEAERIAESQFMKAELKRLKKQFQAQAEAQDKLIKVFEDRLNALKQERKRRSDALQNWLFTQFEMRNALGEQRNLLDIFASATQQLPPAGTGECCAPKLFQYAFTHQLRPVCIAEFWMGASPTTEIRKEGMFYPACSGKCKPTLAFMLKGIELANGTLPTRQESSSVTFLYEDDALAVICKPAGMLSVPGKNHACSVYDIVKEQFKETDSPLMVHRLDRDTSGLLIIAKTKQCHKQLQAAFRKKLVKKRYIALLEGVLPEDKQKGRIELPLMPDYLDRPRQTVNHQMGKPAVTDYEVLARSNGHTLIALYPQTGRTHQLRVHCAHPAGLDMPILGDTLYGKKADRMYLHAEQICFQHTVSGKEVCMYSAAEFEKIAPPYLPKREKDLAEQYVIKN